MAYKHVFALISHYDCEGSILHGIYSTKEKAEKHRELGRLSCSIIETWQLDSGNACIEDQRACTVEQAKIQENLRKKQIRERQKKRGS